jgi:hypothetical protein
MKGFNPSTVGQTIAFCGLSCLTGDKNRSSVPRRAERGEAQ